MDLRTRVKRALATREITHYGPADRAPDPAHTRRRTSLALVAALGVGACSTHGMQPVDAPARSFDLPEIAAAAATHSGHAVSYVHPSRDSSYLEDVNANRVAPDGAPAMGGVNTFHQNQLVLTRFAGNPPRAIYTSDDRYPATCTAVTAEKTDIRHIPGADDAGFEQPNADTRFATLHELGGHCAYLPDATVTRHGTNYTRHVMESQADAVGAALLAAEQGHTRDVRKIADLRAVGVVAGAHAEATDAAGQKISDTKLNQAAYMTTGAMDAAIDWADSRLARPAGDPGHLSNMPAREIIAAATEIALENTLKPAQLTRLNRHFRTHVDKDAPYNAKQDFAQVPAPRDPAIRPAFARIDAAHGRLYGPESQAIEAPARAAEAPTRPRRSARAGLALGG